jgi:hypothetical protein
LGEDMDALQDYANDKAIKSMILEIKLFINRRLFEKGALTEEMYIKARELIIKNGYL